MKLTVVAEGGADFSAFPSVQLFCSWLGIAPASGINGGRAPKAINPVGQALRMAARRGQCFVGARHRFRLTRKDAAVAVTATARELACLIYLMATRGQEYIEQGVEAWEKQHAERTHANPLQRASALGYELPRPADGDILSAAVTDRLAGSLLERQQDSCAGSRNAWSSTRCSTLQSEYRFTVWPVGCGYGSTLRLVPLHLARAASTALV